MSWTRELLRCAVNGGAVKLLVEVGGRALLSAVTTVVEGAGESVDDAAVDIREWVTTTAIPVRGTEREEIVSEACS